MQVNWKSQNSNQLSIFLFKVNTKMPTKKRVHKTSTQVQTPTSPQQLTELATQTEIDQPMIEADAQAINENMPTSDQVSSQDNDTDQSSNETTFKASKDHYEHLKQIKALTFSIASPCGEEEIKNIQRIGSSIGRTAAIHILMQKQVANSIQFKQHAPQRYSIYHEFDDRDHKMNTFIRLIFLENRKCLFVYKQLMDLNKIQIKSNDTNQYHDVKQMYVITNVSLVPEELVFYVLISYLNGCEQLKDIKFKRKYERDWITLSNQIMYQATEEQTKVVNSKLQDEELHKQLPLNQKQMEVKLFRPPSVSNCSKCGRPGHNKARCKANDKVCKICLISGHLSYTCPKKLEQSHIKSRLCMICHTAGHWATNCSKAQWTTVSLQDSTKTRSHSTNSNSNFNTNSNSNPNPASINDVIDLSTPSSPMLKHRLPRSVTWASPPASTQMSTSSKTQQLIEQLIEEANAREIKHEADLKSIRDEMTKTRNDLEKKMDQQKKQTNDDMKLYMGTLVKRLEDKIDKSRSPKRKQVKRYHDTTTDDEYRYKPSRMLNTITQHDVDPFESERENVSSRKQKPNEPTNHSMQLENEL